MERPRQSSRNDVQDRLEEIRRDTILLGITFAGSLALFIKFLITILSNPF